MGARVENGDVQLEGKLPYPKSVFFIVANEFCERFSFYGLRTVLVLYLNYILLYSTDEATITFHMFTMLAYFFPVFGAIIADSWLGRYNTILFLSIVYALGTIVISVTAIPGLYLPQRELTLVGLLLIAVGTGGIKPCVSAFGGDQFVLPQQQVQLQRFFSVFYFAINAGSLISTFLTPVLREDVHCFGQESCFPLAFGVPALLMIVSIVTFVLGSRWYTTKKPEGNVVVQVAKCVWYALTKKEIRSEKREHWLDAAEDRFDKKFIDDVKSSFKVLVMYTPVPIFWALFDQQGSRWTFQAAHMSGDLGGGVYIKPDQMQILNPVMILAFIPLFEGFVYPPLAKINLLKRPLAKMVVGGVLAGLAFVVSAIIEFQLQSTYPTLAMAGESQLRIYNGMGCDTQLNVDAYSNIDLMNLAKWEQKAIPMMGQSTKQWPATWKDCAGLTQSHNFTLHEAQATSYTLTATGAPLMSLRENLDKSDNGDPMVMFIYSPRYANNGTQNVTLHDDYGEPRYTYSPNASGLIHPFKKLPRGTRYTIKVKDRTVDGNFTFEQGGSYVIVAEDDGVTLKATKHQVTEPNSMNILWLIPQYIILTAGEVMFSIPGLEFAFTQAPLTMKSLLTSAWLLTVAFGNLVVIIVAEAKFFDSQAYEFLLFAGLMFLDVLGFMWLAMRYKYVNDEPSEESENMPQNTPQNYGSIPLKTSSSNHQD